jgi:DNA-binding MarR family transcriptional regulator
MTTRRLATDEEARALASALRMRILRVCLGEGRTNKEIAEAVGRDPASTLHHVRRLVDTGFLVAEPVRRGTRGSREIPYRATKKSWQLESPAKDRVLLDAFLEDVALVPATEMDTARLGLRLSPEDMDEFEKRLTALLDEFAALPDDPTAPPWSVFMAIHPDATRMKADEIANADRVVIS